MIRVVLDASALVSYLRGQLPVGELLVSLLEDDAEGTAGVPAASLLKAAQHSRTDDRDRLAVLMDLDQTEGITLHAEQVLFAAMIAAGQGVDIQLVTAIMAARRIGAYLLTTDGDVVRDIVGDAEWIIDIEKEHQ